MEKKSSEKYRGNVSYLRTVLNDVCTVCRKVRWSVIQWIDSNPYLQTANKIEANRPNKILFALAHTQSM